MDILAEHLAYWYFRLNGFLTIPNFVVHPDTGRNQRTDVDILGVRFPNRAELYPNVMSDDPIVSRTDKPFLIIAEVKRGQCALNGPWTRADQQNVHRVLRSVGAHADVQVDEVAHALYTSGFSDAAQCFTSLVCLGDYRSDDIATRYPNVPQILWSRVLEFIYSRFRTYSAQKISHGQWDSAGQELWNTSWNARSVDDFRAAVNVVVGPPPLGKWRT